MTPDTFLPSKKPAIKVVIVVPIYKANITKNERASLVQLFSILSNHHICFFTHNNLDLSKYMESLKVSALNIVYFDSKYFKDIESYNALLCSKFFYEYFRNFDFMLIYQLDAWVFRDELLEWCSLNYDYIGAPWFKSGNEENNISLQFSGVGNGGFSLRKIKSHIRVLNKFSYVRSPNILISIWLSKKLSFQSLKELMINLTFQNNTFHLFNNYHSNEDIFWGQIAKRNFSWFRVPEMYISAKFSFEVNAPALLKLNNNKLPFGCHAWEKYEPDFWRNYIDIL